MKISERFNVNDYCTIITGGARGLGKSMAFALAEVGSNIIIAEINMDEAEKTIKELNKTGIKARAVYCDVTDPKSTKNCAKEAMETFGRIDVLINNAGIVHHENAETVDSCDWAKIIDVNLNGVFYMSQAVFPYMKGKGSIINISSMSGIIVNTPQNQASYNASKAGVIQLTKSLAIEWAHVGIRVNTIAPGYMKTEMTESFFADSSNEWVKKWMYMSPMKRPGLPDELSGMVLYLASDASSFTTGSVMTIDGGYTCL